MEGWGLRSTIERAATVAAAVLLAGVLVACATGRQSVAETRGVAYVGRGTGNSPLAALNAAKINAVYRASVDILGETTALANRSRIEEAIRSSDNPNAYVYNPTLKILQTGGDPLFYEIQIGVDTAALKATLGAMGIVASKSSAERSAAGQGESARAGATAAPATAEESVLSPELRAKIQRDLDQMTYMVSPAEGVGLDPPMLRSALTSAEAYLADNRIPYVDSAQVAALRKDQEMVYEQETNRSVSMTQWIAERLHADVYIVVDASTSSSARDGKYFGSADVSLRIFETSTASGLGAANYSALQPSVSLVSAREAVANAVQSSVYKAMGEAIRQARSYLSRDLAVGIGYDLLVINSTDDQVMRRFMKDLSSRVRDVRLLSWTKEETRYRVTASGTASDLQDLVYAAARAIPDLSGMALVSIRGRELTFDAGM